MVAVVNAIQILLFSVILPDRTVWYVHPDSTLSSIQTALDSCADNDIVLVAPGIYVEDIVWPNTQGIHLISELGPEHTTIEPNMSETVVICSTGVDTTTIIRGFTIQYGYGMGVATGGIMCDGASPTIADNIITDNYSQYGAGAMYCSNGASPAITNNVISNNQSGHETPGILIDGGSAIISYNTIENNQTLGGMFGGINCIGSIDTVVIIGNIMNLNYPSAIASSYSGYTDVIDNIISQSVIGIECYGSSYIRNNTITNNSSGILCWEYSTIVSNIISNNRFLGIYCYNSSPNIDSCTILENGEDGIFCNNGANPIIHNCNILGNTNYGINNLDSTVTINAEYNWWGDSTGPYHPDSNPSGLGDSVSDYVDFIPWLYWPGMEESPSVNPTVKHTTISATIFTGPLVFPKDKICKVFDISGREVKPHLLAPGIYFVEIDGTITQKVVKIR